MAINPDIPVTGTLYRLKTGKTARMARDVGCAAPSEIRPENKAGLARPNLA